MHSHSSVQDHCPPIWVNHACTRTTTATLLHLPSTHPLLAWRESPSLGTHSCLWLCLCLLNACLASRWGRVRSVRSLKNSSPIQSSQVQSPPRPPARLSRPFLASAVQLVWSSCLVVVALSVVSLAGPIRAGTRSPGALFNSSSADGGERDIWCMVLSTSVCLRRLYYQGFTFLETWSECT